MDLDLTPEQSQLVTSFSSLYAKESTPERVRAAEPDGFDSLLWTRLVEVGAIGMAVSDHAGGWQASLTDLSLVAEVHGRYLGTAPLVEAQIAARLLDRLSSPVARAALGRLLEGGRPITVSVRPVLEGGSSLISGAAVAESAIVPLAEQLVLVPLDGSAPRPRTLASGSAADVPIRNSTTLLAGSKQVDQCRARAEQEWMILTAATLVGMASRGLEIGVEYVKERKAWGVPVGSFQSVAHALADSATAVDGARLLTHEAAWAMDSDLERGPELAAMSFAFAYETARDATYRALHFHGGYGFMLEYDIQLYYRRAREAALLWGDPADAYRMVADCRYDGTDAWAV